MEDIEELIRGQVQGVQIKRWQNAITVNFSSVRKIWITTNLSQGIFLVGGFGGSQYLKKHIAAAFPNIQVLQPNNAWAATVLWVPTKAKIIIWNSNTINDKEGLRCLNYLVKPLLQVLPRRATMVLKLGLNMTKFETKGNLQCEEWAVSSHQKW